jgi:hypothetical protein
MKKIEYKGHVIGIYDDDLSCSESPRDWDPTGTIVTYLRREDFTDNWAPKLDTGDFGNLEDISKYLIKQEDAVVILPVYALIHSGIQLSTEPFNSAMDSGQAGFIYATRENAMATTNKKRLTKQVREQVEAILRGEIEALNTYINGEGFGYVIDPVDDEDTCGPHDLYDGGHFDEEAAMINARDEIDGLAAFDEEQALIKNLTPEELPKYINHVWRYPYASDEAFQKRLKEVCNA